MDQVRNVLEDERWLLDGKLTNHKKKEDLSRANNLVDDDKWLRAGRKVATPEEGENIVISGMSGCFPESNNIYEFHDNLANKADMVTSDTRRWEATHPEIPKRNGKIWNVEKFDAGFFGVHTHQADALDPLCRILMEKTFECILDAGIHPSELIGTNTGVYVGACASESEKYWLYDNLDTQAYGITGCHRSMLASRLSYWFKLSGPAFVMDTACSSSSFAFEHAYRAIRENKCDRAIVTGANLCLHPYVTLQFARLGVLSLDGACKCFDDSANGYTRSEAICAILLQKSKESKRIYAEIIHSKVNSDGYKEEGITYPSGDTQMNLIKEVYLESNIDPCNISYMEAHGTGTRVGDPEEIKAIDEVFVKDRKTPLLLGSVKSNIGHTEPTSGLCSIVKCILSMENGYILPNMNFVNPRSGIECLASGKLKVVTEKTPWPDNNGLVGINSFGFGGANCHTILRCHKKTKINRSIPKDNLPRLICVSSRVQEGVDSFFDDFKIRPLDAEFVRILHEIFRKNIPDNIYRGYSIISNAGELCRNSNFFVEKPNQTYAILGCDDQKWSLVAKELFEFKIFAATINELHTILLQKEINLTELLVNNDANNKLHTFLATVATHMGLLNILKSVNLTIDFYQGYKLGELSAAYAADVITAEQCILSAYFAAQNKKETNLLACLKKIFPTKRSANKNWIQTTNSADDLAVYFSQILSNDEEICLVVPTSAVVLEIGNISLKLQQTDRSACIIQTKLLDFSQSPYSLSFLKGLGSLYNSGLSMQLEKLYPAINWPVSRGTPMVSPLIKWDHSCNWFVTKYRTQDIIKTGHTVITISVKDEYWKFISGHVVDGRNLFPATGYLNLAWEVLGMMSGKMASNMNIIFENVRFLRATNVPSKGKIDLVIMVQRGSGNFEVIEGGVAVVTGRIYETSTHVEWCKLPIPNSDEDLEPLKEKDIYKELRLRGYNYKGAFKGIKECDNTASVGKIEWTGNWIAFMDNMLQMQILQEDCRNLYVPTCIKQIIINGNQHMALGDKNNPLTVHVYKDLGIVRAGGIEIRGLVANSIARKKLPITVLETYKFVPNYVHADLQKSIRINMQIALENCATIKLKIVELFEENTCDPLSPIIQNILSDQPLIEADLNIFGKKEFDYPGINVEDKQIDGEAECYMIIVTNLFSNTKIQTDIFQSLRPGGYILARECANFDLNVENLTNYKILTAHKIGDETLILLNEKTESKPQYAIIQLDNCDEEYAWLPILQRAIQTNPNIIIYAQNQPMNGILGFANCMRREPGLHTVKCYFILDEAPEFNVHLPFYKSQLEKGLAINVFKDNVWGTYRHLLLDESPTIESSHCFVNAIVRCDLSSLKWLQGPLETGYEVDVEEIMIKPYYSAVNFRDVMTASGRVSVDAVTRNRLLQDCIQGFEFAGTDETGRRIMGMNLSGALSTMVAADKHMLIEIPDDWTMEEAVTIPVVYNTVLYAFFMRSRGLKRGQSILIHSGTGGVGQAAINIALHYGCTVFTTVGTPEKRQYIQSQFPQIPNEHIGNSRDTSFEQMIQSQTRGKGVDMVLNSLSEEKLLASVRCLAAGGVFLEIGKFDMANDNQLPLELASRNASFYGIMLDSLFNSRVTIKLHLMRLLQRGIAEGAVVPLNRTCFERNEIEQAFRYMATGKHIGKVVIKIRDEDVDEHRIFKGIPRYYCIKSNVNVIIGGLGGFGLELADWLILRGARIIVLTSRNGITTGYQAMRIRTWRSYGATIEVIKNDFKTEDDCREIFDGALELGPIEAIFNLAVVLNDAILENQTIETFKASVEAKANITKYLDVESRKLCPNLKTFVVFSSVSCGRGNAGQTNYGLASSVMERICEKRKSDGLPALAIQWGAVGDVGLVAEMQEDHTERAIGGTLQQRISSCLEVMDRLLRQAEAVVSSMVVAEKRNGSGGAENMVDAVVNILGLRDLKTVSLHSTLAELGMDSMMAVEIKQTLEREYEVFLTPQDIRTLSFARLQEISADRGNESTLKAKIVRPEKLKTAGVQFILRFINDEACSKIPMIRLGNLAERLDAPKIFFLPGVEGFASILEPLCNQLFAHCFCLQFCYDNPKNSIQELADDVLAEMLKNLRKHDSFNLVAYSYGCVVATELIRRLEDLGFNGKVVFIDGSVDMMGKLLTQHVNVSSEAEFQTSLLCNIFSLYTNLDIIDSYKIDLLRMSSYEERVAFVQANSPSTQYSQTYIRQVCFAFYKRMNALKFYKASANNLKSKVVLIKPSRASVYDIEPDYSLSAICEQPVDVKVFDGDHYSILESPEAASEINRIFRNDTGFKTIVEEELRDFKTISYSTM